MKKTYTMLVQNKPGCLDRIAGITRRYGWNIMSMVAAETPDTKVTRITISLECDKFCEWPDEAISKLGFVISMDVCEDEAYSFHEVLVARGSRKSFGTLLESADRISEESEDECTVWWLGEDDYITGLEIKLNNIQEIKAVRSGPMALKR